MRPVRYETHIRQMIRLLDRDQMAVFKKIDLWDYDQVKSKAPLIYQRLHADMPPVNFGGTWPDEWIAVFKRWMDEGFQRLALGTSDGNSTATRKDGKVSVIANGTVPSPSYAAWLDASFVQSGGRIYTLFIEPPAAAEAPSPTLFTAKSKFADSTLQSVTVVDSTGSYAVPIADAAFPPIA